MQKLSIAYMDTSELVPYANNAKKHPDYQIEQICNSINQFGFNDPIAVDEDNVIIEGHGRLLAAKRLGIDSVPVIRLDYLDEDAKKAYILAHNKLTMNSGFDIDILNAELESIETLDMSDFGFLDVLDGDVLGDDNTEYEEFVDKFKPKLTTDDCYTPDNIYEAVADWVANEYGLDKVNFVRPFYPGGDYEHFDYESDAVVVDNPPFSILSQICKFYDAHRIPYFLFAPSLTLFSTNSGNSNYVVANNSIVYHNGANVNTSFVTNMGTARVHLAHSLYEAVNEENAKNLAEMHESRDEYVYPVNVLVTARLTKLVKYCDDIKFNAESCAFTRALDEQKEAGRAIYGGGFLIAEKAAAEKAAAEKAAAEESQAHVWELSERERQIVKSLK